MNLKALCCCTVVGGTLLSHVCSAQAETIGQAVEHMLMTNPAIRAAAYNRLGRDQEVRQAKAGYYPILDVDGGVGYQDIQEPIDDELNPTQMRVRLRQNLYRGLATMNEVDRQEARVRSQAYRIQSTAEEVALRGSEVYLNVLRRTELAALAQENLDNHLRISDQINLRSESGVASKADSDQVAGRVSLAESNIVVTKTNLIDAKSNYLSVVGHMPAELSRPAFQEKMLPESLEDAENRALQNHPTLKIALADLDARKEQAEVAKAPFHPILDVELEQHWDEDFDQEGQDHQFLAMARLRYNLFNGFSDEARRVETKHLVNEAREIRNSTYRQVVESIRLSWMAYQAELGRINYLEKRVASTKATAKSYVNQFNLGKRTLLDVLDTEAEVIDAKRDLVNAQYNSIYNQYRILAGMGQLVGAFEKQWPEESTVSEEGSARDQEILLHNDIETIETFNKGVFERPMPDSKG
ncbi:TolC family outer membrane protein [Desulforhopalus singaporensis]|uniref:Outer membrane protein, adhesin transport system n=1 Tax=Desulforhopalus singaporensis TaxID=91360 RepID=A0A1H0VY70_9BACT|nr:TolC family outer membrane protein [Desulforhopalus singaporensis]SDP83165.1 outer membrane protein, adhesin transport system [Desulforhopalus singaporensis]